MNTPAYDWLAEIPAALKQLDAIPLTAAPPFPWEMLSARLSPALNGIALTIQPGETAWKSAEALHTYLGESPSALIFTVPPLKGEVTWVMPAGQIAHLAALILTDEAAAWDLPHDGALIEGFYRFLALEVLSQYAQITPYAPLTPILTARTHWHCQDALCCHIAFSIKAQPFWGCLLLSPEFRSAWADYWMRQRPTPLSSRSIATAVETLVHLEIGRTDLSLADWHGMQPGDILLCDRAYLSPKASSSDTELDPRQLEGFVLLTIEGRQAFRAEFQEHTLKILAHSFTPEVDTPMTHIPGDAQKDPQSDSWDLPDHFEKFDDEALFADLGEEDLFAEDEGGPSAPQAVESPTPAITEPAIPPSKRAKPAPDTSENQPFNPAEIPVTLVVELGRIALSMHQLLQLEPGNLLDIPLTPQNSVDLTINGKVVGRGELLRIGETLGIRLVQVGQAGRQIPS